MRKIVLTLVISLSTLIFHYQAMNAQTYTIGADNGINGAMSYPSPFGDYFKTMRTQHLYLASELIATGMTAGFISEIEWNVVNLPASVDQTEGYTIKLLNTATASLGLTIWEPGASEVWGPTDYTPILGVNTFILATPFLWDGTSNIIVEICGGSPAGTFTKNARVTWTGPLPFNASRTFISDIEANVCDYSGPDWFDYLPGGPDYRPQINFTTSPASDCGVLPDIGPASSDMISVCNADVFTVSIEPVIAVGISYQWAKSDDGASWSNIAGATLSSFSTSQTEPQYYRCKVTCSFSGDINVSTSVFVDQNDPGTCYCVPIYTTGSGFGDYVSHVVLGAINNTTGALPAPYYNYYSGLSTDITQTNTYTIAISVGTYLNSNGVAAWIDYNQDGVFSATEKLGEVNNILAGGTGNINFTVPVTAMLGSTRMRVREVWNTIGITACDTYGYGETEDYNVDIQAAVAPTAIFTYSGEPIVSFNDVSLGVPTSWYWTFGDGGTSALENPTHTYAVNGSYNACLTVTNGAGTDNDCQIIVIDSYMPPVSSFTYSGEPTVIFDDNSTNSPTSWAWNFGDGGVSILANPIHTYLTNGTYNVCLTATNATGSGISCQNVVIDSYLAPVSTFSYSGEPTVSFDDNSTNSPISWFWFFDDGSTSTLQNPTHLYIENGEYNVCLTATNLVGSNTSCQEVLIDYYATPTAMFSFSGDPTVSFNDMSTNSPTSWAWDFDDGGTSTAENPNHTFTTNGTYNVCLTATNLVGSNTACEDVLIDSYVYAPVAAFSQTGDPLVNFNDLSTNSPSSWSWDFGDGGTSTSENPSHNYATDGTYTVCLTAGNISGSDEECHSVIIGSYPSPSAMFIFSGDPVVTFADLTTNDPFEWFWTFDDGGTSTLQNPIHDYNSNGTFNVCLEATGAGGPDIHCANVIITSNGSSPVIDFDYSVIGLTGSFYDNSTNSPTDWFWEFGDGAISGLPNPTHTYPVAAIYEVCLTATNAFGTSGPFCKTINVGVVDVNDLAGTNFTLFPNPSTNFTTVMSDEISSCFETGRIFNSIGQEIYSKNLISVSGNNTIQIQTENLPSGSYMIRFTNNDKTFIGKFVKL